MKYQGTPSSIWLSFVVSTPNARMLARSSPSIRTLLELIAPSPTLTESVAW